MMAGQALTVQAATGGRLILGIGLSHQMVIENVFGQSFDRPARHMREYLSVLMPLLEGEQVSFAGETLRASTFGPLQIDAPPPPVLVAALGRTMLRLAGTLASGTITWMTGPDTIEGAHHPHYQRSSRPSWSPEATGQCRAPRLCHQRSPIWLAPRRLRFSPSTGICPRTGPCSIEKEPKGLPTWSSLAMSDPSKPLSGDWRTLESPNSSVPHSGRPTRYGPQSVLWRVSSEDAGRSSERTATNRSSVFA